MSIIPWETNDFPIICNNCLGKNEYIRFLKSNYNSECKICNRPFTVFSFKNNNDKYKKSEICSLCSKIKNVCQFCLLDLQFGLPIEIRDKYLKNKIELPKEKQNVNFFINNFNQTLPYEEKGAYQKIYDKIKEDDFENINKEKKEETKKNIENNNNINFDKEINLENKSYENDKNENENENIDFIENVEDPLFKKMMKKYDNPIYNKTENKKLKKKKKTKIIKNSNENEIKHEIKEEKKEEVKIAISDFGVRLKYENENEIDKNFLIRKKKRYIDL